MENLDSLSNKELIQLVRLIKEHQEYLNNEIEKAEKGEEE